MLWGYRGDKEDTVPVLMELTLGGRYEQSTNNHIPNNSTTTISLSAKEEKYREYQRAHWQKLIELGGKIYPPWEVAQTEI